MSFRFRSGPMGLMLMMLHALSMLPAAVAGIVIVVVLFLVAIGRL